MAEMDENNILDDVDTDLLSSFNKGNEESIPERGNIMANVQPAGYPLLGGPIYKMSCTANIYPVLVPQNDPGNSNSFIIKPELRSNAFPYNSSGFQPQPNIENGQVCGFSSLGGPSNDIDDIDINNLVPPIFPRNSGVLATRPEHRCNVSDYSSNVLKLQPSAEIQPGDMIDKPMFEILAPHKIKNPDYEVTELPLGVTTKRNKPVRIKCKMPLGYKCKISLQYEELASKEIPVMICHNQDHRSENMVKEAPKSMFIVKGETDVEYLEEKGHTCCIINTNGEYIIYFLCWNGSCKPNQDNNKKINIHVYFSQNDRPCGLTSENTIKLLVRETLKDRSGNTGKAKAKKRDLDSIIQDSPENDIISKKVKDNQDDLDDPSPLSPEPEASTICIHTNSKERLELYSQISNGFGDVYTIITRDMVVNEKNLSDNQNIPDDM